MNYSVWNELQTKQWRSKEIINCQAWHQIWITKVCNSKNNNNSRRFWRSQDHQADLVVRRDINDLIQVLNDNKLPAKLIIIIKIKTNSNNNNHSKVKLVIKHSQISTYNSYQRKVTALALLNSKLMPLINQKIKRISQKTTWLEAGSKAWGTVQAVRPKHRRRTIRSSSSDTKGTSKEKSFLTTTHTSVVLTSTKHTTQRMLQFTPKIWTLITPVLTNSTIQIRTHSNWSKKSITPTRAALLAARPIKRQARWLQPSHLPILQLKAIAWSNNRMVARQV